MTAHRRIDDERKKQCNNYLCGLRHLEITNHRNFGNVCRILFANDKGGNHNEDCPNRNTKDFHFQIPKLKLSG
jgi:hypothetical protein